MKARMERFIDLLVDEVEERLQARQPAGEVERAGVPDEAPAVEERPLMPVQARVQERRQRREVPAPRTLPRVPEAEPLPEPAVEAELAPEPAEPLPIIASHTTRLMARLALGVLIAIVAINIPFNRHGTTLATAMPYSASLIIRDGLLVKEADDPEIYVYQDGKFRWISSLDAFDHYGYTWGSVHVVEDGYLAPYEFGSPIHVLLKCPASPHIYRLEEGKKRWIRDIDTFEAEGHIWQDVRFVSCDYLRDLPDGETVPPDSGPPPQP